MKRNIVFAVTTEEGGIWQLLDPVVDSEEFANNLGFGYAAGLMLNGMVIDICTGIVRKAIHIEHADIFYTELMIKALEASEEKKE